MKRLFLVIFFKFCMSIRISIVRSLLHVNGEEHLMCSSSANKTKPILKACLYLFVLPCHGNTTYTSVTIKIPRFVMLLWILKFLATKRSRVLQKDVNQTRVFCSATLRRTIKTFQETIDAGARCGAHLELQGIVVRQ